MNDKEEPDSLMGRLQRLNQAQQDMDKALRTASSCFAEMSKDKPPPNKTIDQTAKKFYEKVGSVDEELHKQIEYLRQVSVGSCHEGSTYLADRKRLTAQDNVNLLLHKLVQHHNSLNANNIN